MHVAWWCGSAGAGEGCAAVAEEKVRRRLSDYLTDVKGVSPEAAYQEALELSSASVAAARDLMDSDGGLTAVEAVALQKIASDHGRDVDRWCEGGYG
ncbi:hypothetical protein [Nocardioides sp. HB32]